MRLGLSLWRAKTLRQTLCSACLCVVFSLVPNAVWGLVEEEKTSPIDVAGWRGDESGFLGSKEEEYELEGLARMVSRYEGYVNEFEKAQKGLIQGQYQARMDAVKKKYDERIDALEGKQSFERNAAIEKFENFVRRYPKHPRFTPGAIFRLAELYFERSSADYLAKQALFERDLSQWSGNDDDPAPIEPTLDYGSTIDAMTQIVDIFPNYRLVDGAYYLLGYCLGEQGEFERSISVFLDLGRRFPNTPFLSEIWTRVGEFYFDSGDIPKAIDAYGKVLEDKESSFYDKALYKKAWGHYRLAKPRDDPRGYDDAADAFIALLDFEAEMKAQGSERGRDLHDESVTYLAVALADEDWGGLGRARKVLQLAEDQSESESQELVGSSKKYAHEVLERLAQTYSEQTRYALALDVYAYVQDSYPLHAKAPQIQNAMIVANEKKRDFSAAAAAREGLVADYQQGGLWWTTHQNDPDVVSQVSKLVHDALLGSATYHHRQAQLVKKQGKLKKAQEYYWKAALAYGNFIEKFPHEKSLYDLKNARAECLYFSEDFENAAEAYLEIRDMYGDEQFRDDAAQSVVLALEASIKIATDEGRLSPRVVQTLAKRKATGKEVVIRKIDLEPLESEYVLASDIFSRRAKDVNAVAKVRYKAAELLFSRDHIEDSRGRFLTIIAEHPAQEVAQFSVDLVVESYLLEGNYTEIERFSEDILASDLGQKSSGLQQRLASYRTGARLHAAAKMAEKGLLEEAADHYLKTVAQNPKHEMAATALNNAAVAYESLRRYDSATQTYRKIFENYRKSEHADRALFRVGLNAERFFDLKTAQDVYRRLVRDYPKSPFAADALYNLGSAYENTTDYAKAAKVYRRYCKTFASRDDAAKTCLRAGQMFGKMKRTGDEIKTYRRFIAKNASSKKRSDDVIQARLLLAQAMSQMLGAKGTRAQAAKRAQVAGAYRRVLLHHKKSGTASSAKYAAEASFYLLQNRHEKFASLRIEGRSKKQKKDLKKKAKSLAKLKESYEELLAFKQLDWTLAALFRIGSLYDNFGKTLLAAPCPMDVRRTARKLGASEEEVCDEYRVLLEEKAATIEDKAVLALETTIERSREFQRVNAWTLQARRALHDLRPATWPPQSEAIRLLADEIVAIPSPKSGSGKPVVKPIVAEPESSDAAEPSDALEPAKTKETNVQEASQ